MPPTLPAADPACPNCTVLAPGRYCAACGQEQGPLTHSVRDIGREFVEEYFSYDNKVWRTVKTLALRPGLLTTEYLAGRRASYLRPLRLYLTASVVYFLVFSVQVSRGWSPVRVSETPPSQQGARPAAAGGSAARAADARRDTVARATTRPEAAPRTPAGRFESTYKQHWRRVNRLPVGERQRLFAEGIARNLPNAMFVLMPLFAALLKLLYRRSRRTYAEHFVFALHLHAFAFFAGTIAVLLPGQDSPSSVAVLLWIAAYLAFAMRRVYAQSWTRTAAKYLALLGVYFPALGSTVIGLLLASMLAA